MALTHHRLLAFPLILLLTAGLTTGLSGCGVQTVVKHVTHGNVDLGGKSVPKDFPKAVPLVKGTVVFAASAKTTGRQVWNLTVKVRGTNAATTISDELTDAGFIRTLDSTTKTRGGATLSFEKAPYTVLVVVAKGPSNDRVANYTVTQKD